MNTILAFLCGGFCAITALFLYFIWTDDPEEDKIPVRVIKRIAKVPNRYPGIDYFSKDEQKKILNS
jgi:hypothetical protein